MSNTDFTPFIDPANVPRIPKAACRMSFDAYPPFLEPLLGMWGPLSRQPLVGVTNDGKVHPGLYGFRSERAPVEAAAIAANRWLESLDTDTRAKVCFPVQSELWRHWQNTPLLLRDPQIELEELGPTQRELGMEVVKASLSAEGARRTREVMLNNFFLGQINDLPELLGEWAFTLSIFGTPSTAEPWGWQLFGHHLSVNCLFIGDQMVLSPVFMGVEPDREVGPQQRRLFEPHEYLALTFMRSLTDAERNRAILYDSMLTADQPPGRYHQDDGRMVGGAYQDNRVVPYEGLNIASLDAAQQRHLLDLAGLFVANMPDGPAEARLREIESYFEQTHFAWIGQANDIDPFYFRIHSPVALIEFDHHSGIFLSNKDPARFHVHTVVRSPNAGDYGRDLLRQHYAAGGHDRHVHDHGHSHGSHSHDGGKTFHSHD
jgi:hypothetical protein